MPEQIPSAILDSANSFDSLFALELDTKQRFDNILSGIQTPINYPIPDFEKEKYPNGLPQEDLMNPTKMSGSIGEALFSADPKISAYATDKLRSFNYKLPVMQGVGVPDRFSYSKEMDKYLNGDWGYNPYASVEDNEDFNYRYDYMNQNVFSRIFKNVGVGVSRFVGGVALKLGQTFGHIGSMIGNGIEEIFDPKGNNFMSDVADNSLSRWFSGLETDMKNSNLLSVFKPKGWEDKGFFDKLGNGAFWTDEIADGAAFMGEMVAGMYLTGGLGRLAGLGKLGATEINLAKSLGKLGGAGRVAGKGLDVALKLGTGADDLAGVGRWAFSVASESAFEASGLYQQVKDQLKADRHAGKNNFSDAEIEAKAGDRAAASFKGNMLVLSASNAFENRFIFGPLFKKGANIGPPEVSGFRRLIGVNETGRTLETVGKASRKEFTYKTWLGKKLNWKDSNSRLNFYGSRGLSATAAEGFWEENAQLAIERLASADVLSPTSFVNKLGRQTLDALSGRDPEASTNIGLGAIIGIGGTSLVSGIAGGERSEYARDPNTGNLILDPQTNKPMKVKLPFKEWGERKANERNARKAVTIYENARKNFLNFQDIYVRDKDGNVVPDADGSMQIDELKLAGLLDGNAKFLSKQIAADKAVNPLFRKELQDGAMMDYVTAAKNAGIYSRAMNNFSSLKSATPEELKNLGFDPNTTVDYAWLKDSLNEFGKLWDEAEALPPANKDKDDTQLDEEQRKHAYYKAKAGAYSNTKIMNEYQSKMMDKDFPSVFSPEAQGNSSEITMYNSLVHQQDALDQMEKVWGEHTEFFDGFVKTERRRLVAEQARIKEALQEAKAAGKTEGRPITPQMKYGLEENVKGLLWTPAKYDAYVTDENKDEKLLMHAIETDAEKKHAEYTMARAKNQYLANKFGNQKDGLKNLKEYGKFYESIHKRDAAAEGEVETVEGTAEVPVEGAQPATNAIVVPPAGKPVDNKAAAKAQQAMANMSGLLTTARNLHERNDPNHEPDFNSILSLYANNEALQDELDKILLSFLKVNGEIVLAEMRDGTFEESSPTAEKWAADFTFMDALSRADTGALIGQVVIDYMDTVDAALENYVPPVVELTEAEQEAITILNALDIPATAGTFIGPILAVLKNPDSTNAQKKTALKSLSDQLKATETADTVGEILGDEASEAIFVLKYPKPVTVDLGTEQGLGLNKVQKYTMNVADTSLPQAPEISNDSIDWEKSGGEEIGQGVTKIKLIEVRGKNDKGELVGTVRVWKEGSIDNFDVIFKESGVQIAPESSAQEPVEPANEPEPAELTAGDVVTVNTKKDGTSTIKEIRGDKALLEDGRTVSLANLNFDLEATKTSLREQAAELEALALEQIALEKQAEEVEAMIAALEAREKVEEETKKVVEDNLTEEEKKEGDNVVEQVTAGVMEDMTGEEPKPRPSWLRRLINKIKKILIGLFTLGTIYTGITGFSQTSDGGLEFRISNTIDKTLTVLPQTQQEWAKRFLEKQGIYESKDYTVEVVEDIEQAVPVVVQPDNRIEPKLEVLASVPDSYNTNDSLLVYRSTWNNVDGFEYVPGPNNDQGARAGIDIPGVIGVGHFLLDASLYGGTEFALTDNQGFLAIAKANNDFVPAFTRLDNGNVRVKYKRYNALQSTDIVVSPLRQYHVDKIAWIVTGTPQGFKSNIKEVKLADGSGTYLIFKDRDGYSRFSGGSVVFIFEKNGNQVVIDFAGSLNMIQKESERIIREYGIAAQDLILGYHDVGSFSAKPKAKGGVVNTAQYTGYNNMGFTGGSLLIPAPELKSTSEPVSAPTPEKKEDSKVPTVVTLSVLLATIRRKQAAGEPLEPNEIAELKRLAEEIKKKLADVRAKRERASVKRRPAPEAVAPVVKPVQPPAEAVPSPPQSKDTGEGSGVQPPVKVPPPPPDKPAPSNTNQDEERTNNLIDVEINAAKKVGKFTFIQNQPESIVMDDDKPKIVDGAIQLKTSEGDQALQLRRQHNILKKMGERTNPTNFWSLDENGKPLYRLRLEFAGVKNERRYEPWVYNTAKGLINPETDQLYQFPFVVAMVVDQEGKYVFFDNEGNVVPKVNGTPFGVPYNVEDYKEKNLKLTRKGEQLKTGETLSQGHGFLNEDPLEDLKAAIMKGIPLYATIDSVTSGKLSTYDVDNSGATYAKEDRQQRTLAQMIKDGDIEDSAPLILETSSLMDKPLNLEYSSANAPGAPTQLVKVGQPHVVDSRTGIKIPLRGKLIKDLTIDGKPFVDGELKEIIQELESKGSYSLPDSAPAEAIDLLKNVFETLRILIYSQNTPIFMSKDGMKITMLDQRPDNIPLLDTEVNYSQGIETFGNPLEDSEFSYNDFVQENFLSGAIPAEVTKGQKSFEKLNRRIIFTLEKDHQALLNASASKPSSVKTVQYRMTDYSKFINKSFKQRKGEATFTVTSFSEGKFTVANSDGTTTTIGADQFMKDLRNLEEVTLPSPSPETAAEVGNTIDISKDKLDEIREKSKDMTKEDEDNVDLGC